MISKLTTENYQLDEFLNAQAQYTNVRLNGEFMKRLPFLIFFSLFTFQAHADLVDELEDLIGYVIVDSKTIQGWYDDDESDDSSFNGCSHGRVIVFTDNKKLTCAEYGYQYAYRPKTIILAKEISYQGKSFYDFKMVGFYPVSTDGLKRL